MRPSDRSEVILIGEGPAGLVALAAPRPTSGITKVAAVNTLASFVTDEPYTNQRLGTLAPGILRDVGDVAHLAALCAAKAGRDRGWRVRQRQGAQADELAAAYEPAARVFKLLGKEKDFVLTTPDNVLKELGLTARGRQEGRRADLRARGEADRRYPPRAPAARGRRGTRSSACSRAATKGIHQLTPDGEKKSLPREGRHQRPALRPRGPARLLRAGRARRQPHRSRRQAHRPHRQLRRQEVQPAERPHHRLEGPHLLLRPALRLRDDMEQKDEKGEHDRGRLSHRPGRQGEPRDRPRGRSRQRRARLGRRQVPVRRGQQQRQGRRRAEALALRPEGRTARSIRRARSCSTTGARAAGRTGSSRTRRDGSTSRAD